MPSQRNQMREDVRFRILRLLQENPEITQRELAKEVGVSTGGVHYVLSALLEKGSIKLENFSSSSDKRRYAYFLTPKGIAEKAALAHRFLARKMAEYQALKAEIQEVGAELSPDDAAELHARLDRS